MQKYVKTIGDERLTKVPNDLDLKPYRDEHDDDLLRRMLTSVKAGKAPKGLHVRDLAEAIVATAREPLLILSADLRVRRANRAFFESFPDLKFTTERLLIDGNQVVQISTMEGTDIGGFMGLEPKGRSFKVPAVFFYELRDGLIARERRIYDFTGMLVQVGVLKAKPV